MAKDKMKKRIRKKQNGIDPLSGVTLSEETPGFDTDRIQSKAAGGIYTDENTRVVDPVAHQQRHGTLRIRPSELEGLKATIDDREQVRKLRNKISNQLLAFKRRTDHLNGGTREWLESQLGDVESVLKDRDKTVEEMVKEMAKENLLMASALGVASVGIITVGYCTAYIDLEKSRYASSLWSYAGLHRASHERYPEKGTSGGGNKTLRTALYTMADSQMKGRGAYRNVYDNVKHRLSHSNRIVESRNTQGHLVKVAWKDTKPSHRHGAALRAIMKHFLADYYVVGRTLLGLPAEAMYVEAKLEGHKITKPKERGWIY